MNYLRSATHPGAAFSVARRPHAGHMVTHYLLDLAASVSIVLIIGWLIEASASETYLRDALVTQNEVYVAIGRFTPRNLVFSYFATVHQMIQGLPVGVDATDGLGSAVRQAFAMIGELVLNLIAAMPRTLLELYQETSGAAAWIVLAGFGIAGGTVITALLHARTSLWRLPLVIALCPLAISVVFLVLQGFMVLMLDAFFWFTTLAPYTVACPVLCTLYWVAFPNAERGATATVANAVLRIIEPRG